SLQQQVAQLIRQAFPITGVDGVQDLIGLFEQVRLDGVEILFAIPGAAARRPQLGHDLDQTGESGAWRQLLFRCFVGHETSAYHASFAVNIHSRTPAGTGPKPCMSMRTSAPLRKCTISRVDPSR